LLINWIIEVMPNPLVGFGYLNLEKRPLSIPTMNDRARQALVKLGMEPEWEAQFEGNSYGFRPGRSTHDAIEAIFNNVSGNIQWENIKQAKLPTGFLKDSKP